jgi:hypothetical protein
MYFKGRRQALLQGGMGQEARVGLSEYDTGRNHRHPTEAEDLSEHRPARACGGRRRGLAGDGANTGAGLR